MTEQPQPSRPAPLSEDEKALLRRCYRIRRITDDEIVFPIEAATLGKAGFFSMVWLFEMSAIILFRWMDVPRDAPSAAWTLLGILPGFLLIWLVGRKSSSLVVRRGVRSMEVIRHDGRWTIHLPHGSSPAEWGFPSSGVPARLRSDDVERVAASEVLERFSGSSLSETREDSFLGILDRCRLDVVGYDEASFSVMNFCSARQWVGGVGLALLLGGPFAGLVWMDFVADDPRALMFGGLLGILGSASIMFDSRASSVATFLKGKRSVRVQHRSRERTFDVHESAVSVGGENNYDVIVGQAFSCSPSNGTQELLVGFFRKYLSRPRAISAANEPTTGN
jgi:hypothetical protein